jgi:hypothetical protein
MRGRDRVDEYVFGYMIWNDEGWFAQDSELSKRAQGFILGLASITMLQL